MKRRISKQSTYSTPIPFIDRDGLESFKTFNISRMTLHQFSIRIPFKTFFFFFFISHYMTPRFTSTVDSWPPSSIPHSTSSSSSSFHHANVCCTEPHLLPYRSSPKSPFWSDVLLILSSSSSLIIMWRLTSVKYIFEEFNVVLYCTIHVEDMLACFFFFLTWERNTQLYCNPSVKANHNQRFWF